MFSTKASRESDKAISTRRDAFAGMNVFGSVVQIAEPTMFLLYKRQNPISLLSYCFKLRHWLRLTSACYGL